MSGPVSAPTPSPERREWGDDPNPAEHPCAGACRGCGAGVDEACYPPCRCDEGHDCAEAKRIIAGRPPELLGDFLAANPAVLDAVVGFVNRTRPPAPSPDPRSPEDGAVERGERSEHERWFVIHVNQISALRFAEFPVERLARASVAACNCGPHQIRKTTTVTYTDHGELELVPATPTASENIKRAVPFR